MLFRLLGKTVWFVGKMTVKHVVVPIAITAATAVILGKLAERLDASHGVANGHAAASASASAPRAAAASPRARKPRKAAAAPGPSDATDL